MPFGANAGTASQLKPTSLQAARAVGEDEQPQWDNIFKRSERSLVASGSVAAPGAGVAICKIDGFKSAKQFAVYRLDYVIYYSVANGVADDMAIFLGGAKYLTLLIPPTQNTPIAGTAFIAPNGGDVEIDALAGSGGATYHAQLILTRALEGFRAG